MDTGLVKISHFHTLLHITNTDAHTYIDIACGVINKHQKPNNYNGSNNEHSCYKNQRQIRSGYK